MIKNSPKIELPIIGYIRTPLSQKFGVPRQPNLVKIPAVIEFISPFDAPSAFEGIEKFSHLWLIWQFHQNHEQKNFRPQVRPPRLGGNDKIGVFATRSMYRPANIGLSVVQLEDVEGIGGKIRLHISGADMVDSTPIVDIKPYIVYSDSVVGAKSGFAENEPVRKTVIFTDEMKLASRLFFESGALGINDIRIIHDLIAQDPRPAYRQSEVGTIFTMRYKGFDIGFFMNEMGVLVVEKVVKFNS